MSEGCGFRRFLAAALLIVVMGGGAQAQQRGGVERTEQGVVIDFQQADLRMVVSALAEAAGLNVVYGNLPTRPVTLRTSAPVPVAAVRGYLESVLRSNNLELVEEPGGLLRVVGDPDAPEGAAGPVRMQRPTPQAGAANAVRVFVYPLRHAPAEGLARTLSALFGLGTGGLDGAEATQPLSEQLRRNQFQLPPEAVQPTAPAAPRVQVNVDPRAATQGLTAGLVGPVQVVPDPRTNSLLIRATPADYATIRSALEQLDTRPEQVLIEVLIAEVRRDRQFGLGLDFTLPEQREERTGAIVSGRLTGSTAGDVVLRFRELGNVRAEVILSALASSSNVTVLSRPVLTVQNNQEARILVGDQRPFVQLFRALPTDNAVRDQVVQYRDVGTQLTIRPTINPDGYVNMAVLQEVSNATEASQFGAPIISTREAQTQLLVRDGQTVVIGGLVDRQQTGTNSGIPLLRDIPLLGNLFRSTQRRNIATELFLFITPHVLRTDEETDDALRLLEENAPLLRRALPDTLPLLVPDSVRREMRRRVVPKDTAGVEVPEDTAGVEIPPVPRRDAGDDRPLGLRGYQGVETRSARIGHARPEPLARLG